MMRIAPRPQQQALVPPGQIEHHVRDMTAVFAADVTLADAQHRLATQGQWLPIDGDPSATLGRLLESNSTGPLRLGYGAWRDLLLGCQFTNGAGELITAGGRTVKNVAGYDLTKFMVGQFGIFGRIVTITVRTYRRPEAALLAAFTPDVAHLNRLLTTPARPQWSVLRHDALRCGYLGDARTIAFYESELPRHAAQQVERRTPEADAQHRHELWSARGFRAAVPPASIGRFVSAPGILDWSADAAFGIVIGSCDAGQRSALDRAARELGGSILFFEESGQPLELTGDPAVHALLQRLKRAFDPDGALEPIPAKSTS